MEQPEVVTAPRSLKERQRQEREALILQVAEEVLVEKGYYETSIDEIAARVGIAKGTVYLHFPSKEELIFALVMREVKQVIADAEAIANSEGSAQSKLERILLNFHGNTVKRMRLLSGVFHSVAPSRLKEHGKNMMALWGEAAGTVEGILDEGKASGEFTDDVPTVVMASAFFSLMSPGSYALLKLEENNIDGIELARCLGRIYCKGITRLEGESK